MSDEVMDDYRNTDSGRVRYPTGELEFGKFQKPIHFMTRRQRIFYRYCSHNLAGDNKNTRCKWKARNNSLKLMPRSGKRNHTTGLEAYTAFEIGLLPELRLL
jgi:hypothetical protein